MDKPFKKYIKKKKKEPFDQQKEIFQSIVKGRTAGRGGALQIKGKIRWKGSGL